MKYKDVIRTIGTSLLATTLCLTLTTACFDNGPKENPEDSGGGGQTESDYYDNYTDNDLTYDEAADVYIIRT